MTHAQLPTPWAQEESNVCAERLGEFFPSRLLSFAAAGHSKRISEPRNRSFQMLARSTSQRPRCAPHASKQRLFSAMTKVRYLGSASHSEFALGKFVSLVRAKLARPKRSESASRAQLHPAGRRPVSQERSAAAFCSIDIGLCPLCESFDRAILSAQAIGRGLASSVMIIAGSAGLTRCASKPASDERRRSSDCPQPVSATSSMRSPQACSRMRRATS